MSSDTTFITNEEGNKLFDRFNILLKDTEFFDCLVGYFYVSGFYKLENSLVNVDKIRILVGMGTDLNTFKLIDESQQTFIPSNNVINKVNKNIIDEMNNSPNNLKVEKGARTFIDWLINGKLEIRAYKERTTHSKLYIMTFPEDDKDDGRVITGSSNLTRPGLDRNLEFNVELKDPRDHEFAKNKFEELWENSVPVTDEYVKTLPEKTWLKDDITPYELYLKFIYEYLYEKIDNDKKKLNEEYYPPDFKYLEYQRDAVIEAKSILEEHNGVFLSDVVGLGKTYMGTLLAQQLKGTTLVIAPPALISEHNVGGWKRVLREFEVNAIVESKGKLDHILKNYEHDSYKNVIIDESHSFRNEETGQYENLSKICKGKKVILISATPYNNSPSDLLSQIKLFQKSHKSTLPNPKVSDLESYFNEFQKRLSNIDKNNDPEQYLETSQEIAEDIRENVLKYLMVRRTRSNIAKYYKKDLDKNNMTFPEVQKPKPVYYKFNEYINNIFDETVHIITKQITYAKYKPLIDEYNVNAKNELRSAQNMMSNFIKILFIKRLESGIGSFRKSIDNAVKIHKRVIKTFDTKHKFYTSKDYNKKIFECLEKDDLETIDKLLEEGKAKSYDASEFKPEFREDLEHDLKLFEYIQEQWSTIENYPKKLELVNLLNSNEIKGKKVIIFTEFIDTANDIIKIIRHKCTDKVLLFTGNSTDEQRNVVLDNFDANKIKKQQKNDYDILISTDVLSHGVNLHRSNIIINYDIPWNPTKMMQRVGRIQRLDTKFKKIYIYNFFPTENIEDNINIEKTAKNKIAAFITLLGNDSQLLTEEPIKAYSLFNKINSNPDEEEELVDDELKYLALMRDIRDNNFELFKKIEELPKKARVTRSGERSLITLMKSKKFKKVFKTTPEKTIEIDFFKAIKILEASPEEKSIQSDEKYYEYLHKNLTGFEKLFSDEGKIDLNNTEKSILKIISYTLKFKKDLTSFDINYLIKIKELLKEGSISKKQEKNLNKHLKNLTKEEKQNPHRIIDTLRENIAEETLNTESVKEDETEADIKEIILSEYFIKEE